MPGLDYIPATDAGFRAWAVNGWSIGWARRLLAYSATLIPRARNAGAPLSSPWSSATPDSG